MEWFCAPSTVNMIRIGFASYICDAYSVGGIILTKELFLKNQTYVQEAYNCGVIKLKDTVILLFYWTRFS